MCVSVLCACLCVVVWMYQFLEVCVVVLCWCGCEWVHSVWYGVNLCVDVMSYVVI